MKKSWEIIAGILLGLGVSFAVLVGVSEKPVVHALKAGPLMSETEGTLEELVVQYVQSAHDAAAPVLKQFLPQLSNHVRVYVVVPDIAEFEKLRAYLGPVRCRLIPVAVGHPLTAWSRDRWLAFEPNNALEPAVVLAPRDEKMSAGWAERAGDKEVAADLAKSLINVSAERSELLFEAGDFVADSEAVFVTPEVLRRNVQHTVRDEAALQSALEQLFKRRVVILREAPEHHAAMFMMLAGDKRAVVGDPSLAEALSRRKQSNAHWNGIVAGGGDFSEQTQRMYDAVAAQCAEAGYQVVRVPQVHSSISKGYVTYVNVLIDSVGNTGIVYLPVYDGLARLNEAAADTWRALGYEVRPVNVSSVYRLGGTLHCLVNVLRRVSEQG